MRAKTPTICMALLALASMAALAPAATAHRWLPPKGKAFLGYTDSGDLARYQRFARAVGKHPPVIATYDHWGKGKLKLAFERWESARARPMLSLQTALNRRSGKPTSPGAIAQGRGDDYLLFLNRRFAEYGRPAYVRALPEPNGHWNPYCPYNEDGSSRGPAYSQSSFRLAWRRMVIMIRDGGTLRHVNERLRKNGLPPVRERNGTQPPPRLEQTKVAFVWTPQTFGSPDLAGNMPSQFWPGGKFVDWVGTDFYSKFPNWSALKGFYHDFKRMPFAFGEWGVWGADDPGFVRHLLRFQRSHKRVRMLVYYNGGSVDDGAGADPFDIAKRPRSRSVLRHAVRRPRFPAFALEWAQ